MTTSLPQIFDRALYLARQKKASVAQAPLLAHIAADLSERLSVINHRFEAAIMIAPQEEPFATVLKASGKFGTVKFQSQMVDDDLRLEAEKYQAVVSLLDLQCINDVPGYLVQCARALRPDGLFIVCCFAGDTLREVREAWLAAESETIGGASMRVAPMIGIREMGSLLQRASLALPVTDNDRLTLRYKDAFALMQEIKSFGYANALLGRRKAFTSQRMLGAALRDYQANNADPDGRVRATLDLLWALAWKPHESQPRPLQPGSAKARLADVLRRLGEEN